MLLSYEHFQCDCHVSPSLTIHIYYHTDEDGNIGDTLPLVPKEALFWFQQPSEVL